MDYPGSSAGGSRRGGGNLSLCGAGAWRKAGVSGLFPVPDLFDKEKYGEIEDYYNAYTWGEIMKTDQVVDFVMEALPEGISKAQVKASVSVGQMNDVKIMPLYITTQDAGLSQEIAKAYVYGLDKFAKSIEGLSGMQCWTVEPATQVPRATKTVNAFIFGGILGAVLSFLVLVFFIFWMIPFIWRRTLRSVSVFRCWGS